VIAAVVGAQFGSEGKGKVAALLSRSATLSVRSGGPNAGHSFEGSTGAIEAVRMLPCGVASSKSKLAIGPGAVIDIRVLEAEIVRYGITPARLLIDEQAFTVTELDIDSEEPLVRSISSTGKGAGAAVARRILGRGRGAEASLARNIASLAPFIGDLLEALHAELRNGGFVVAEGTQGFGLSLYHGAYPFVTSRDTTAGALCSEMGIATSTLTDVVLVVRTFPIRVAGPSGPLPNEINWDTLTKESYSPSPVIEYTTVTQRIRRVARFDASMVRRAILANAPTAVALMQVDYLDHAERGKTEFDMLTRKTRDWILHTEQQVGQPFGIISTGPRARDTILRQDVLPTRLFERLTTAKDDANGAHGK
jgi:adenylosuccinate synthase